VDVDPVREPGVFKFDRVMDVIASS
jgi:hypothetical protein